MLRRELRYATCGAIDFASGATSLVLVKEGVRPVFADIDPRTHNIDPAAIEKKITRRTKAIYVVHYGGQCCDMCPSPHPLDRFPVKIRDSFSYVHLLFPLVSMLGIGSPRWSF